MKRWIWAIAGSLAFTSLVLVLDLPFKANFYRLLLKLRGPIPASSDIVLLLFDVTRDPAKPSENEAEASMQLLESVLGRLAKYPPRAVQLDFQIQKDLEKKLKNNTALPYPVFANTHDPTSPFAQLSVPFLSSPDYVHSITHKVTEDPFITDVLNVNLLQAIFPNRLDELQSGSPQILNILGPPGTYSRVKVSDLLSSEESLKTMAGKVVLLGGLFTETHVRYGEFAFYSKGGARGFDETEIHANFLDNVMNRKGLKVSPPYLTVILTTLVSIFTVFVLLFFPPVVGVLAMILLTICLIFSALVAIGLFYYVDIHASLFVIVASYYFLIPYRLILEYKQRWEFEQVSHVKAQVDTLKDNFMSLVSHNLRTPIARIQGQVENLLAAGLKDPNATKSELQNVLNSTEELNKFVSQILSLAQVERPDYQMKTSPKDINQIVEKLVMELQPLANEKHITISTQLEPLFPVSMDPNLIQQSAANLLENAIKYTPEGGQIQIITREDGPSVELIVSDTGPGISKEDQGKIFSKFYRGIEVKNKGIGGTGLGLYLVKYFVELHGGTATQTNRPTGGSEFKIRLIRA